MRILGRILYYIHRKYKDFRNKELKKYMGFCGENVSIDSTCNILVPEKLYVGNNSSIGAFTSIFAGFGVTIGKDCLISSNCGLSSVNHTQNALIRYLSDAPEKNLSKPIVIGNNVWLGMGVIVLPGVHIGDNSIVGAGGVVTKSIPSNEIWVGNPARFVKKVEIPD